MSTTELSQTIIMLVANNFPALLVVIATGAGIKIVLDIIFKALYSVTKPD